MAERARRCEAPRRAAGRPRRAQREGPPLLEERAGGEVIKRVPDHDEACFAAARLAARSFMR